MVRTLGNFQELPKNSRKKENDSKKEREQGKTRVKRCKTKSNKKVIKEITTETAKPIYFKK